MARNGHPLYRRIRLLSKSNSPQVLIPAEGKGSCRFNGVKSKGADSSCSGSAAVVLLGRQLSAAQIFLLTACTKRGGRGNHFLSRRSHYTGNSFQLVRTIWVVVHVHMDIDICLYGSVSWTIGRRWWLTDGFISGLGGVL